MGRRMQYKGEENACIFNLGSSVGAYILQVAKGGSEGPYSTVFRAEKSFLVQFPIHAVMFRHKVLSVAQMSWFVSTLRSGKSEPLHLSMAPFTTTLPWWVQDRCCEMVPSQHLNCLLFLPYSSADDKQMVEVHNQVQAQQLLPLSGGTTVMALSRSGAGGLWRYRWIGPVSKLERVGMGRNGPQSFGTLLL